MALKMAYRNFDTAKIYGSEAALGNALTEAMQDGTVEREDIFVTSKLWGSHHHDPVSALRQSLKTVYAANRIWSLSFGGCANICSSLHCYAAGDPRHGALGAMGPLAIGLMAGANVLATGPFSGGSMNPACAFGSAVIAGTFKNQAVYWVGPLIGAAVAGLLYDNVVFPVQDSLTRNNADGIAV